MKRRAFTIYSALGVAAISLPIGYYHFQKPEYDVTLAEPELLSHIWDSEAIERIGMMYRERFSDEDSGQELVSRILSDSSGGLTLTGSELEQKIALDFEKDEMVMIDGWLLSRTEARQ